MEAAQTLSAMPERANQPDPGWYGLFFGRCRVRLGLKHLAAAIETITGNAMTRMSLAALGVDGYRGSRERGMRPMHSALGRGLSAFLNCHECYVLSSFLQQILQSGKRPRIDRPICPESHRPRPRRPPQFAASCIMTHRQGQQQFFLGQFAQRSPDPSSIT
jgi:hypothetical protein